MTSTITGRFTASLTTLLAGIALVGATHSAQAAPAVSQAATRHITTAATSRTASLATASFPGVVVKMDGALLEEMDTAFPDSHIERYRDGAPEPYEAKLQTAPKGR